MAPATPCRILGHSLYLGKASPAKTRNLLDFLHAFIPPFPSVE